MNILSKPLVRIVAALLLGVAVAGAPALSYASGVSHFGGGGGHSMGGGHMGGGHMGGGGHFGGGGHVSAPHFSSGHVSAPHFSAAHSFGGTHFSAPHSFGATHFSAPHFASSPAVHGAVHGGFPGASALHAAHPGGFVPGWHGGGSWGAWHGWGGGYWHGSWWPHVWFGPGFAWFLPVLPFGYATYWWGGVPYYYYNDLYYTYSPSDNGYVVTDPPPVAGSAGADGQGYSDSGTPQYSGGAAGDVYLYPRNGQSDEQTQTDRYECHSWAVSQSGFDPTRSSNSGNAQDYRRAMIACLDARGYSAR